MQLILAAIILVTVGCSGGDSGSTGPKGLFSYWTLSGQPDIDLRSSAAGVSHIFVVPAGFSACDCNMTLTSVANGGSIVVTTCTYAPFPGATICDAYENASYSYAILNGKLQLCQTAPTFGACLDYN